MDCLAWLGGEDLAADEAAFWAYLGNHAERYPVRFIPPFKAPKGPARVRRIIGCGIRTRNDARGQPVPRLLQLYDGASLQSVAVDNGAVGAAVFADRTLTKANRSAYIVFANGGRVELRLIAQQWASHLIELGYTVDVLMGGSRLKALLIRKGRHVWYLCCAESLTGLTSAGVRSLLARTASSSRPDSTSAVTVWHAVVYVQDTLRSWFGTGLSVTVSNTGLRAAARTLPSHVAKFRPLPMLVSMCRAGGGFRGGLVKGSRYRGPSWLVDLNRAYTAALRYDLPWRSVLDRCEKDGVERNGMFMCRVTGRWGLPTIYVGRWTGDGVETAWHNDQDGTSFLAILSLAEVDGIRRLGYRVEPGYGMVYVRTFTLNAYVDRLVKFCQEFGWSSVEAKVAKALGNAVYGKLAAPAVRRDLRISKTRPSRDWLVFVDEDGVPVEDLWERQKTTYQWSQHIDVAADITARVRGWVYDAQATMAECGGRVLAVSTDAVVVDTDPEGILDVHMSRVGAWKLAGSDADGVVVGPNAYSVGAKTIVPDLPEPTRADVVSLYTTSMVSAETIRNGAPRPGAPLSWRIRKTITLGYAAECTTTARASPPS